MVNVPAYRKLIRVYFVSILSKFYNYASTIKTYIICYKKWQYRLTTYHIYVTMLGAKECWTIEITNIITPQTTCLKWPKVFQTKRPTKLIHSSVLPTIQNLQEPDINQKTDTNFLHILSAENIMLLKHKVLMH